MAIDPVNPSTIYAGTYHGGVYKSIDGGLFWKHGENDPSFNSVTVVAIDPKLTNTLYAGTDRGIIKSTDGGVSWFTVSTGLIRSYIMDLVIDPVTPSTLYAGTFSGVFISTDSGESWTAINTGLTDTDISSLAIDPLTPTHLYAGTFTRGIFKSMNGGTNWKATGTGLTNLNVADVVINPVTPTTVYIGVYDGIFCSLDGGESWKPVSLGTTNADIRFLQLDPLSPTTLYAITNNGGLYKSSNSGKNWIEVNPLLTQTQIRIITIDPVTPSTLFVGTEFGLFKSLDGGLSWSPINKGIESWTPPPPPPPGVSPAPTALPEPILVTPWSNPSPSPIPEDWRTVMDAFGKEALNSTPLAGLTMAIRRPGEPDWIQAYGYADLERSIPASPDTVFQIGSLSMQFTSAAIMQLVESGQLDLHAPISQYLDGLPTALQSITIHQLLTHTSLIHDPVDTQELFFGLQDFTSEMLLQELVPLLYINPDLEEFSYGNYILAGLILEKVSGMTYYDYMQQFIFSPIGLQHTSYCLTPPPDLAQTYYLPNNQFIPIRLNVSAVFTAGGLCSTAGDMLLWMDALTTGKIISPYSYQQMITPAPLLDGSPGLLGYGLYAMHDPSYGLQVGFFGSEASFVSDLIAYPEKGLTIVLLSNTAVPDNDLLQKIWKKIPILIP